MTALTAHEPVIPTWSFGDRIRKVRKMQGMEQAAFALALGSGITRGSVQNWESGISTPRPATMTVVAITIELRFGVPVEWLLEGQPVTGEALEFARYAGRAVREYAEGHQPEGDGGPLYAMRDLNPQPAALGQTVVDLHVWVASRRAVA